MAVVSRQQQPMEERQDDSNQEYEEWRREQKDIPPWEVTYDDYLESMK